MWEISLSQQAATVILSLFAGGIFSLIFDTFKAARIFFDLKQVGVFISDIAFFVVIAPIEFCFLLSRCNGEIRGFVLAAQLLGFFICRATISKLYLKILMLLLALARKVIRLFNSYVCKYLNHIADFFKKSIVKMKNFHKNSKKLRKKG